ncbi:hypothetical protein BT69DRAFT_1318342 [Atractiella rhizophila]|nr:hypothetical protein BT69DRAFT_1318342 [Atractiella rhizophila]
MSLSHFARTSTRTVRLSSRLPNSRPFSVSGIRSTSANSHVEPDPNEWDKAKGRKLSEHESVHPDHAPGWNEKLASHSEAHVKADRSTKTPQELLQAKAGIPPSEREEGSLEKGRPPQYGEKNVQKSTDV